MLKDPMVLLDLLVTGWMVDRALQKGVSTRVLILILILILSDQILTNFSDNCKVQGVKESFGAMPPGSSGFGIEQGLFSSFQRTCSVC